MYVKTKMDSKICKGKDFFLIVKQVCNTEQKSCNIWEYL